MTPKTSFIPRRRLLAAVAIIALPGSVLAQDPANTAGARSISLGVGIPNTLDLHGHVGVGMGIAPDYEGGNDTMAEALPLLDIRQQDFVFVRGASTNPNDGYGSAGWHALNIAYAEHGERKFGLSIGPVVRFSRGRKESDSNVLNGLGNIDDGIGAGGFIEARAGGWLADVSAVSQDAGEAGEGLLVSMRSVYTSQVSDRFSVTPGVFASWGDDDFMQGVYGVSASQAANSGLSRFNAGSGFKDVGLSLRTDYLLSDSFSLSGELGYQLLLGDAADSPIVDGVGSADRFRALIGVAYNF